MKKQILNEVNRVREIMGLTFINEQEEVEVDIDVEDEFDTSDMEADMKKVGHKIKSEVGEYKTFENGQPYELFMAKSDALSKAYLEVGEYDELDSKSLYYKYRRINPYTTGGYEVNKVQEVLDDEIQDALKNRVDYRMDTAKTYGWFRPNELGKGKWCQLKDGDPEYCLGETHLEEFGDIMKVYKERIPQPDTGSKKDKEKYKRYKEGKYKRYYLDKKGYKDYLTKKLLQDEFGGSVGPKLRKQLEKLELKYQKSLTGAFNKGGNEFTDEYQYSNSKARRSGWEKNPDYNPEGATTDKKISKAKKEVSDVNFSPTDKYAAMEYINEYIQKTYDGNYEAAMSDGIYEGSWGKLSKLSKWLGFRGWVVKGIDEIVLRPKNIKTKVKPIKEVVIENITMTVDIEPSDADGQLFANNLWKALPYFEEQIDEIVDNALIQKANVSEKAKGGAVTMFVAKQICSVTEEKIIDCSKMIDYPYTLWSSCSRVPNCVDDQGVRLKICGKGYEGEWKGKMGTSEKPRITFEQLSKNRANTAMQLIAEKLGAIGVEMYTPEIVWEGTNEDGTSGPDWKQGDPLDSEEYKEARYVRIQMAIGYEVEQATPEPPKPETYKVGDLKVTLSAEKDEWCGIWCWLFSLPIPKWKFRPFKKRFRNKRRPRGGYNTTGCPQF